MKTEARQRIFPMLAYDDAPRAIEFLRSAFGFQERFRFEAKDGTIGHAEVELCGNIVMVATTWKAGGMASPKELAGLPSQLFCEIDDVDAHFRHARDAGVTIVAEPAEQPQAGYRMYRALDCEGHRWLFASPTRLISC
jgi:uncharacterized glyoxalase superfamily protein PhnB